MGEPHEEKSKTLVPSVTNTALGTSASTPGRPPRLFTIFQHYDPPLFFVTMCSYERRRLFDNALFHRAFSQFAERGYSEKGIAIGRYVLMPDHLHLFVRGGPDFVLEQWARMFKRTLGKTLSAAGYQPELWRRGFFDHLIRNNESYGQKWNYVRDNPLRAGLVTRVEEWPWQGEMVNIDRL